jgi:hypothetical protein
MKTQTQARAHPCGHFVAEIRAARKRWGELSKSALETLKELLGSQPLSIISGDILFLEGRWYITHSGLLRLAMHNGCSGILVQPIAEFCDALERRWAFKAVVYKSCKCKGFVGYGDADPSNISPLVRGAEMRVAETSAVNRALRKAYGIGICSVEEIASFLVSAQADATLRKLPPQAATGNAGPKLRDQLCLLIRQHRLDVSLVKSYAAAFCGVEGLRQASREQIQSFIAHLAQLATKDRDALLCKLNSYGQKSEVGAA